LCTSSNNKRSEKEQKIEFYDSSFYFSFLYTSFTT
jgi:hypothetical protein